MRYRFPPPDGDLDGGGRVRGTGGMVWVPGDTRVWRLRLHSLVHAGFHKTRRRLLGTISSWISGYVSAIGSWGRSTALALTTL